MDIIDPNTCGKGTDSTKEQIIKVTLEIIAQEGVHQVKTREIATRAGVNVAAVNYHFGSKANLINQSIAYFIKGTETIFDVLNQPDVSAEMRLKTFLHGFMFNAVANPGVIKSIIGPVIEHGQIRTDLIALLKKKVIHLKQVISDYTGVADEQKLAIKTVQAMSGMVYPVLLMKQLPQFLGIDVADEQLREHYIEQIMRNISS